MRGYFLRRFILGLGALLGISSVARAQDFSGVYKSSWGILTLKQTKTQVVGAFSRYDGVLEGNTQGQRLTFTWRDGLDNNGSGEFVLDEDKSHLIGSVATNGKSTPAKPFAASRLSETPTPAGAVTYWDYNEIAEPASGNADLLPSAKGTAELFLDGNKVTGCVAGRIVNPQADSHANDIEAFMTVTGTLKGNHLKLHSINMADFSDGEMDLKGNGQRFTGQSVSDDGSRSIATLTRRTLVRMETLTEQAWTRHNRLWRTSSIAGKPWASPVNGDPRFSAMELLQSGKTAEAAEAFALLAESYANAGDVHNQISALVSQASALARLGRFEDARQVDMRILALPGITESERNDALFDLQLVGWKLGTTKIIVNTQAPSLDSLPEDDPLRLKDKGDTAAEANDFDAAIGFYNRSIESYQRSRQKRSDPQYADIDIAIALNRISRVEIKREHWAQAEPALQREIAIWRRTKGAAATTASSLNTLGYVLSKLRRLPDAIKAFDEAVTISGAIQDAGLWRYHGQRARAEALVGRKEEALADFARAVALVESIRGGLVTDETKVGYFTNSAGLYEDYVDYLMLTGDVRQAFTISEKARARALLDAVDRFGKALPANYAFPSETASTSVLQSVTANEATEIARTRHNAFLVYFLTAQRGYVWLIGPDGSITSGNLEANAFTMSMIVPAYLNMLVAENNADSARRDFTDLVSAPVAKALTSLPPGTKLIVVSHKDLAEVPFSALGENVGDWGTRWVMTSLPSVSAAKYLTNSTVPKNGPLLAVGDTIQTKPRFPNLINSRVELDRVAAVMAGSTILRGVKAVRANVLEAMPKAKVILFSTHSTHSTENGQLALQLSSSELLQQKDLKRETLNGTSLVILSACEIVTGEAKAGDELMNFARAFLVAGAERVLITLWTVEDKASAEIVSGFLGGVHKGLPPALALQQSVNHYRHLPQRDGTLPNASAWVPWVLVGRND